jgi:hypothetical protein
MSMGDRQKPTEIVLGRGTLQRQEKKKKKEKTLLKTRM